VARAAVARDAARKRRLAEERQWLERELARAVGLGKRARPAGSLAERARINVQRRVKDAISRVAEVDRELGLHLKAAIRTGTWCTYRP
jgi:hypothetical protein